MVSLDLFNTLVSTFYFLISTSQVSFDLLIILKIVSVLFIAMGLAFWSIVHKLQGKRRTLTVGKLLFLATILIILGIYGISFIQGNTVFLFLIGASLLLGFLCLCIACIMLITRRLKGIRSKTFLPFKMTRTVLRKDATSYGLISFVLSLTLGLIICMGIFVESFRVSVSTWLDKVMVHSVYIQDKQNDINFPSPIHVDLLSRLEQYPTIQNAYKISRIPVMWRETPVQIHLTDSLALYQSASIKSKLSGKISSRAVFISEPMAVKHGLKVGDTLMISPYLPEPFLISAIIYDYANEFGTILMERASFEKHNTSVPAHGIALSVEPENLKTVLNELKSDPLLDSLKIQSQTEIRDQSIDIFNETFVFTWFMVSLIGGISLLCLTNLLTIICLDRQSEFSQLWQIGLKTKRLSLLVCAQLVIIVCLAVIIAICLGALLYYFLVYGIQLPTFGWSIFLTVPYLYIFINCMALIAISLVIAFVFVYLNRSIFQGRQAYD